MASSTRTGISTFLVLMVLIMHPTISIAEDASPPLDVVTPVEDYVSNQTRVNVTGTTSPLAELAVEVVSSKGTRAYNATATSDGAFHLEVELFVGNQTVIVTSTGPGGITNYTSREVNLDLTPPDLTVEWPTTERTRVPILYINGTTEPDIAMVIISGMKYPVVMGEFMVLLYLQQGPNRITVEVRDSAGNIAREEALIIYDDDTPPRLRLDVPVCVGSPSVHVRGNTDANVNEVTINGRSYPVENGSFDVVVVLKKGRNRIVIEVRDPADNLRSETVVVRYGIAPVELALLVVVAVIAILSGFFWYQSRPGLKSPPDG